MARRPPRPPRVPTLALRIAVCLLSSQFAAAGWHQAPHKATQPISSELSVDNWGLDPIDGARDGSFEYRATGAGINIFIIDTGVNLSHVDFGGRAVAAGAFFKATTDEPVSRDVGDCNADGHGTRTASYAAGRRYGVAKGATIYAVRAAGGPSCDSNADSMRHAVNYVTRHYGPGVVNISFSGLADASLAAAIRASMDAGFVYTLSAGCVSMNKSWPGLAVEPDGAPQRALIVAGVDERMSGFGRTVDYGANLSLFAPGAHLLGAGVGSASAASVQRPLNDSSCSDSFAAPHVAGAAALYLERHPGATPLEVHDALVDGAVPAVVPGTNGTAPNRFLRLVY